MLGSFKSRWKAVMESRFFQMEMFMKDNTWMGDLMAKGNTFGLMNQCTLGSLKTDSEKV